MSEHIKLQSSEDEQFELSVTAAYSHAAEHFNAGRFAEAEGLCNAIIQVEPRHIDAINVLGVIAQNVNRHDLAVKQFQRAILIDDSRAILFLNLGISLIQIGEVSQAIFVLKTAIKKEPDNRQIVEQLKNLLLRVESELHYGTTIKTHPKSSPATAREELQKAMALHQAGELAGAIACYQRALGLQPDYVPALGNLGNALNSQGKYSEAIACYEQLLSFHPNDAMAYNNIALAKKSLGELLAAISCLQKAVAIQPGSSEILCNLGSALRDNGELEKAVECYLKALAVQADHVEARNNLGVAFARMGELDRAITNYRQVIAIQPDHGSAYNNLGVALKEQGQLEEAVVCLQKSLSIAPDNAEALSNLGAVLQEQGKLTAAAELLQKALANNPELSEAHNNLGNLLREQGKLNKAYAAYSSALLLQPDYVDALCNIASVLIEQGEAESAGRYLQKVVALEPNHGDAYCSLGAVKHNQGELAAAAAIFQQAITINPRSAVAISSLLLSSQYNPDQLPIDLLRLHKKLAANLPACSGFLAFVHDNEKSSGRQLRIGLLSPDLGQHPVGYFMAGFLRYHLVEELMITCYSDHLPDKLTAKLESYADRWLFSRSLDNAALAKRIHADKIDILIDLAGHTANNRLPIFAAKPAPIQISWAGYVGTTGLPAMDWLIADRHYVGKEDEQFYSEGIIRLPDSWVCYTPPKNAIKITKPKKIAKKSSFMLGNFGNPTKINQQMLGVWSRILQQLPGATLLLIYKGMDDPGNVKRINDFFKKAGIESERVIIKGKMPHLELLAQYNAVDLALDTLPYSGGLTTLEALWMGTPVVTTRGATFAGRHSTSILRTVGLDELVAEDLEQYVQLVIDLGSRPKRVQELCYGLRERLLGSPLCNYGKFSNDLTMELKKVWSSWCAG